MCSLFVYVIAESFVSLTRIYASAARCATEHVLSRYLHAAHLCEGSSVDLLRGDDLHSRRAGDHVRRREMQDPESLSGIPRSRGISAVARFGRAPGKVAGLD